MRPFFGDELLQEQIFGDAQDDILSNVALHLFLVATAVVSPDGIQLYLKHGLAPRSGRCMEYEAEERPSADETRAWLEVIFFCEIFFGYSKRGECSRRLSIKNNTNSLSPILQNH